MYLSPSYDRTEGGVLWFSFQQAGLNEDRTDWSDGLTASMRGFPLSKQRVKSLLLTNVLCHFVSDAQAAH